MTAHDSFLSYKEASQKLAAEHAKQKDVINELQSLLRQRDDFLAHVSHSLRTPLQAVLGYGELLQHTQRDDFPKHEYLTYLTEAARTMLTLLSDMPSFSHSEPSEWIAQPQGVNLGVIVPQLEGFFAYEAHKKRLEFSLAWDETIPSYLYADLYRIRQVMVILAHHALRATETGYVRVGFSLQDQSAHSATIQCTVEDSSEGQSRSQLDILTAPISNAKPFGRANNHLLLAQQGIEWLGGQLQIDEIDEKISRFHFLLELPILPEPIEQIDNFPSNKDWKQKKVLIADDHAMNRDMLRAMLHQLGIGAVETASSGVDAMAKCRSREFNLLLMDCQMPDMDGFTAARILKNNPDNHHMPIIGVSADVMKADKARCMAAGMEDMFPKPLQKATLEKILLKWL